MRFFNTAGPVNPEKHYALPPLSRWDLVQVETLIDQEKYFVLHAPRQTGKTTCLLALQKHLNATGRYLAIYANIEAAQAAREDVAAAMRNILNEIAENARRAGDPFLATCWQESLARSGPFGALGDTLTHWAENATVPLVLLLDEVDSLVGDTLISLLRQLRTGYTKRPGGFPQSVVLCGVRDVRDYRLRSADGKDLVTGGSAFNIKAESLRLGDFTSAEIILLLGQHTTETGQVFLPKATGLVWELTQGQPWLVNALAYEVCFRMKEGLDRTRPVQAAMIDEAKERLILRRDTHIDQLADKLREERVRRIVAPLLAGDSLPSNVPDDDVQYLLDLGLLRRHGQGLEPANPIYREVMPRQLVGILQLNLESSQDPVWYVGPDDRLAMTKLLAAFQDFFREHSEHWLERFEYREAGPQLLLQAFLQRVVNGGGRVEREYGLGRMRTDLLVIWPAGEETQWVVLELKVVHKGLERTIAEGLLQTAAYMDRCRASEGHLLLFDRNLEKSWEEKIFRRQETSAGHAITVWGM